MTDYAELAKEYKKKKNAIKARLKEFERFHNRKSKEIFPELCFCILTPQSNARNCDKAIRELKERRLLFTGRAGEIRRVLKGKSRFHNKKADYIVNARRMLNKKIFDADEARDMRDSLVKDIKGIGYKEASHFLRNIGLGKDIAILDRHILKNFKRYGIISKIPACLTPEIYLGIEDRARRFAKKVKIPLEELDLLFWSRETGEIFK